MSLSGSVSDAERDFETVVAFAQIPTSHAAPGEDPIERGNQFPVVIDLQTLSVGQHTMQDLPGGVTVGVEKTRLGEIEHFVEHVAKLVVAGQWLAAGRWRAGCG